MKHRNDRLHAGVNHLADDLIVELQALFIRLPLIPAGKNPRPCDRKPEAVHAHFLHQRNVFLIAVIEAVPVPFRIVPFLIGNSRRQSRTGMFVFHQLLPIADPVQLIVVLMDVRRRQTASVYIVSPFDLAGRRRAAPQKVLRKLVFFFFHRVSSCFELLRTNDQFVQFDQPLHLADLTHRRHQMILGVSKQQ